MTLKQKIIEILNESDPIYTEEGLDAFAKKILELVELEFKKWVKKVEIEEYRKGYNQCLKDQHLTGEEYTHLYL